MKNRHDILLQLLEKSGETFYRLLTRLTLREDIAEELMQELFMKLSNSNDLNDVKNLDAYARRAAQIDFSRPGVPEGPARLSQEILLYERIFRFKPGDEFRCVCEAIPGEALQVPTNSNILP